MSEFVKIAKFDRLHESRGTLVAVKGDDVVLFKRGETVYAISNVCAHQHFSKLHDGPVAGFEVTCPMHGWSYDMRTGIATSGQGRVATYAVKVVGNDIMIASADGLP